MLTLLGGEHFPFCGANARKIGPTFLRPRND